VRGTVEPPRVLGDVGCESERHGRRGARALIDNAMVPDIPTGKFQGKCVGRHVVDRHDLNRVARADVTLPLFEYE
jgi:hypothetical protein